MLISLGAFADLKRFVLEPEYLGFSEVLLLTLLILLLLYFKPLVVPAVVSLTAVPTADWCLPLPEREERPILTTIRFKHTQNINISGTPGNKENVHKPCKHRPV